VRASFAAVTAGRRHAVLGMHRSGTSWLAGALQEKGLELGEVSTADAHNLKGNRESKVLMALHDAVLADNGGSWKRPTWPNRWSDARRAELASFVAAMDADYPFWGFKDPRALLVLDEWLRQVPDLVRVGIYRHPLAVHQSLAQRSERFDESRSLDLWRAYNERLVAELARSPFPLLRFDVPRDELSAAFERVAGDLRLPRADRPSGFFDEALVHNEAAGKSVPRGLRALWDELESHRLRV
jgi:hypothetical protein